MHDALKEQMQHIHALSIKRAWTPAQQAAEQQKAAAASEAAAAAGVSSGAPDLKTS